MAETYYHGGYAGLRVGQHILPPTETGVVSVQDLTTAPADEQARIEAVHRRDRVYLTVHLEAAKMFAGLAPYGCCHRGGDVYRVEPVGGVEPDPDWLGTPGESVCAEAARIVGIVATGVRRKPYLPLLAEAVA